MVKSNRRLNRTAAAAMATASILLASPSAARRSRPPTNRHPRRARSASPKAATSSAPPSASVSASNPTVFSCGATLAHAISQVSLAAPHESHFAATLCPTGLDSECPHNEYCYAGIPSNVETKRRMLQEEATILKKMVRDREDGFNRVDDQGVESRFVCGTSWEEAVEFVCESGSSSASSLAVSRGPIYCPSGLSSQCPTNMDCYASVNCPTSGALSAHNKNHLEHHSTEEEILLSDYDLAQNLSSFVTDPVLLVLNTTSPQGAQYPTRWESILSFGPC
ncbi:hypothetical protein HJC23_004767 [Cyclotella cryptica]|uniref:Uncharacterized protein n=1 Tax=Cyclotella cryptica TaxID=29204 RepID=A0ABD3PBY0_9STRA|eukprot:CCRYP_015902-RA/>CCRYP_015902-RA protein AED:0.23 eAED:0.23 QI:0/-1/0/1/-1/1/1/0/278